MHDVKNVKCSITFPIKQTDFSNSMKTLSQTSQNDCHPEMRSEREDFGGEKPFNTAAGVEI